MFYHSSKPSDNEPIWRKVLRVNWLVKIKIGTQFHFFHLFFQLNCNFGLIYNTFLDYHYFMNNVRLN
jgi:hypothetical protein